MCRDLVYCWIRRRTGGYVRFFSEKTPKRDHPLLDVGGAHAVAPVGKGLSRYIPILTRLFVARYNLSSMDEKHHELFVDDRRRRSVTKMPRPVPISLPPSEFNDFLFAPIGEDRSGMLISVLSGLARSDMDPWQEAAKLAQLPGETAAQRLAALIDALPDRAASYADPRAIATRLVALLPHSPEFNSGSQEMPNSAWAVMNSRPWWVYVLFMSFMLGSQFLIASHQLPTKVDKAVVNASNTVSRPVPPVNSDQ